MWVKFSLPAISDKIQIYTLRIWNSGGQILYILLVWWGKWWVVSQSICVNHFHHVDCQQQQVHLYEETDTTRLKAKLLMLRYHDQWLPYFIRDSDYSQLSKVRCKFFILLVWLLQFKRPWNWQDRWKGSAFTESFAIIFSLDNIPMHMGVNAQRASIPLSLTGILTPFWS